MTNLTVVGQGYVGLPLSIAAARSGYKVKGFDIDVAKIENLKIGVFQSTDVDPNEVKTLQTDSQIHFTSEKQELVDTEIFVIAVPTPLDKSLNPDFKFLELACEIIGSVAENGALIINESTSSIGTLRSLIKPRIDEFSLLTTLEYAVAPERIDPGNKFWSIENTPRVVAGLTDLAAIRVKKFYEDICQSVTLVSQPEVAEASKLFENTFRQVNISIVNVLSELSWKYGFSTFETINAAATKPFGFMPFYPGIGIGGHCIPVDPIYLLHSAKQVGLDYKFIELANENNFNRAKIIINRISDFMKSDLKNVKIQVAGISYKPNISDIRESPVLPLITELRKRGAIVTWSDPLVKVHNSESSTELDVNIDLGLIVTPHNIFNFNTWRDSHIKVLDLSSVDQNFGWPKFI
jgi:UDP-N-acetyl-D-glucosamine dehydrogenase